MGMGWNSGLKLYQHNYHQINDEMIDHTYLIDKKYGCTRW